MIAYFCMDMLMCALLLVRQEHCLFRRSIWFVRAFFSPFSGYKIVPVAGTSIISICYLPESPHWLLSVGRMDEAKKVIEDAAAINGIVLSPFQFQIEHREQLNINHYIKLFMEVETLRFTLPLWSVWALFGFTYYGVILFVGRVYSTAAEGGEGGDGDCSFDYQSIFIKYVV